METSISPILTRVSGQGHPWYGVPPAALLAAGVTVQHHEQVVLAKVIRGARFLRWQFRSPEPKQTLLGRGGGDGRGGGRPLGGGAAEVRVWEGTGGVLGHHGGQLLRFGVERVTGQHLAQVRDAGGAQHVFAEDGGVVAALGEERWSSAGEAERQGRVGVRHQATEGLERVEEAVRPREQVHVVVGARERGRVEAPGRAALQHAGLVALVLQHYGDAGQGHRHDGAEVKQRFKRRMEEDSAGEGGREGVSYKSLMTGNKKGSTTSKEAHSNGINVFRFFFEGSFTLSKQVF